LRLSCIEMALPDIKIDFPNIVAQIDL
jgi:hypothetical protein